MELEEAADWYETHRQGLGRELIEAVRIKISTILDAPDRWPSANGVRRALVSRFPYALVYRAIGPAVEIVAVAHVKRRPRYWATR